MSGGGVAPAPASADPVRFRPRSLEVAGWTIHALSDGWLRLDGGGMWGVVPKALWRRWTPPDADNTIPIALRPFLAPGNLECGPRRCQGLALGSA